MVLTCKNRKVRCDLTAMLDRFLYGLSDMYYVYIPEDDMKNKKERFLAICRPGRSIGEIEVDENDIIVQVRILDHGLDSFTEDVNGKLKMYVGQKLKRDEVCYHE